MSLIRMEGERYDRLHPLRPLLFGRDSQRELHIDHGQEHEALP